MYSLDVQGLLLTLRLGRQRSVFLWNSSKYHTAWCRSNSVWSVSWNQIYLITDSMFALRESIVMLGNSVNFIFWFCILLHVLMKSTTFRNQTMCILFLLFTLHYMFRPTCRPSSGAIWQYYNGKVTEYLLHGSTEWRYYIIVVMYYISNMQYEYTTWLRCKRYLIDKLKNKNIIKMLWKMLKDVKKLKKIKKSADDNNRAECVCSVVSFLHDTLFQLCAAVVTHCS
jgi:hypothetical protein